MKEGEMDEGCSIHGKNVKWAHFGSKKLKGRESFGDSS
jgi:hypothetical protein